MSNTKQSSVEWYIIERDNIEIQSRFGEISPIEYDAKLIKIEEQAKAMHKEETIKLYNDYENYLDDEFKNQLGGQSVIKSFEQYYNEHYGK